MMKFLKLNNLLPVRSELVRDISSVLFISGNKASQIYSAIKPHVDFNYLASSSDQIKDNLQLRKKVLNVETVCLLSSSLQELYKNKQALESKRNELFNLIKEAKSVGGCDLQKLSTQFKIVKDDLEGVNMATWGVEEIFMPLYLAIPAKIHEETPKFSAKIVHKYGEPCTFDSESHVDIGRQKNVLKYFRPETYYLEGKAALLEIALCHHFSQELKSCNFIQTSNSDLSTSITVEGCGVDFQDPSETFVLKEFHDDNENRNHLVGGASLFSFCCLFARQMIVSKSFESFKCFSVGRQYLPQSTSLPANYGLFNVCQSTAVEAFIVCFSEYKMKYQFQVLLKKLIGIYDILGFPYEVKYIIAEDLKPWESLRVSFTMFSPHLKREIEIGNISVVGDFISKRLLFASKQNQQNPSFVHIISGNVFSFPKFLGCVLEISADDLFRANSSIDKIIENYIVVK